MGVNYPDLVKEVPRILMSWYQADVLTEEAAKQWGTHVSKKYVDRDISKRVRKASEPFLKASLVFLLTSPDLTLLYSGSKRQLLMKMTSKQSRL